jgi:2-oxoglutarate ferredoxin oxidoreductase subunit alpha
MKHIISVEMSAGQMVEDVMLAACGKTSVSHFGRMGGVVTNPEEVLDNLKSKI